MDAILPKLTAVFREAFEDDSIVLRPDLTAIDVTEWDSLSHVRLVLGIERAFGIRLPAAQAANLEDVGELVELVRARVKAGAGAVLSRQARRRQQRPLAPFAG